MPVLLELASGATVEATITDLSRDGFRLRSNAPLHAGRIMKMHLPRETLDCELRWTDGKDAGGVFHDGPWVPQW